MAAAAAVIWFVIFLSSSSAQHLGTKPSNKPAGICLDTHSNSIPTMQRKLKDCVVVVGNLRIVVMESTLSSDFASISFPNLREVTGFVVIYRVLGLESIGQLFPNLTRIRGHRLINNYGLIVHDMTNLREVGLYSLLKIDRGGVSIWGGPHTCYVKTINWGAIAPRSRHFLTYPEMTAHCNMSKPCKCGTKNNNFCWNSKKCQRFLPVLEKSCHPECLGCNIKHPNICSVCRNYTYQGRCVSQCPPKTILLPANQYCLTTDECSSLKGWTFNNTCVFNCPVKYERVENNGVATCERCYNCKKVCQSMIIHSLREIQQAENCVYINGSLTIHVSSVPGAVDELKKYLALVEVVIDYVYVYSSVAITSFGFLGSLKRISGRQLESNAYSLVVHDMNNLQKLFPPAVMKDLHIDRGKFKVLNNPKLCMNNIKELEAIFPIKSNETDIPPGLNGYSGGCEDSVRLHVKILNETAATVLFTPINDSNVQYTILYAKVPLDSPINFVPEACSEYEWFVIHSNEGEVLLTSLHPASTYAVCIEILVYSKNPVQNYFTRTTIANFTMPFVKPEPPFINEIVATSSNTVGLRWVDHRDYRSHITNYQLDVTLIDIPSRDVKLRDHCSEMLHYKYEYDAEEEYSRHAVVLQPPVEYKSCDANCPTFISVSEKMSLIEDRFDICNYFETECNQYEEIPPRNSSFKNYVKTLALNISAPTKLVYVEGLAPFRDYRFSLRACARNKCSRSTKGVVRTLRSNKADIPSIKHSSVNESSNIFIKWDPPDETNGPIFVYLVQVLPGEAAANETLPDVWCVYPEVRSLIVRSHVAKEFQVRVCSSTLGSLTACSEWLRIDISVPRRHGYSVLLGIIFSIILTIVSIAIGIYYNRRTENNDIVPLVDMTSMYRSETDPPVVILADFMPLYSVPLNDALVDYL